MADKNNRGTGSPPPNSTNRPNPYTNTRQAPARPNPMAEDKKIDTSVQMTLPNPKPKK